MFETFFFVYCDSLGGAWGYQTHAWHSDSINAFALVGILVGKSLIILSTEFYKHSLETYICSKVALFHSCLVIYTLKKSE